MLLQIKEPEESALPGACPVRAVGIDLGTTNCVIAVSLDQKPFVLAREGERESGKGLIPSVVFYGEKGEKIVGTQAKELLKKSPQPIVTSIKRLMGRGKSDEILKTFPHKVCETPRGLALEVGGTLLTPVEISADILNALHTYIEKNLGYRVFEAVITVPAYFDEAARAATRDAARLAGFEVLRLINEPTAAALAYGLDQASEGFYGVYDLGGGTFDFSLLKMEGGLFQVLGTGGDLTLGGDDFDAGICLHFLKDRFCNLPFSQKKQALEAARKAKERLLKDDHVSFSLFGDGAFLGNDEPFSLSRDLMERLLDPYIQRTLFLSQKTLDEAGISKNQLEGIIFVGGSTRLFYIEKKVADFFGRPILTHLDPDHAVALGAALQAEALTYGAQHLLLDITPLSLGLETMGGGVARLIPKNSPIPFQVTQEFTTFEAGQTAMLIHVLQGERERVQDCRSLAHFELHGIPPMPAGMARVQVTFSVDADGLLTVCAKEKTTGKTQTVQAKPTYGLSPEIISRMILEGREMAGEDVHHRLLVQKKMEATQSLQEIKHLLAQQDPDLFTKQEREDVENACAHLQKVMTEDHVEPLSEALSSFKSLCLPFMERRLKAALKGLSGSS